MEVHDDCSALPGQCAGYTFANSSARALDDRDVLTEPSVHVATPFRSKITVWESWAGDATFS